MAQDQGYNGWKNYETWAMALWIDNDEGLYNESRELVRRNGGLRERYEVADALKDMMEELRPELEASVWSDLLSAAFSEVDWFEIAENYIEEVQAEATV